VPSLDGKPRAPLADPHADWSRLDGEFSRFPVGARKVGWIAATCKAVEVNDIEKDRPLIKVNCAAINKDLYESEFIGHVNVFPIEVAPLCLRRKDILLLAEHFLRLIQQRGKRRIPGLSSASRRQLQEYEWPGNVRELQNVIERAVITAQGNSLHFVLPEEEPPVGAVEAAPTHTGPENGWEVVPESEMRRRERRNIIAALMKSNGKIYGAGGAAALLGIKPTTLSSRIKKMRIKKPAA
jgi:transcriptional regulator with GAF, ATPase, and Fis domain